MLCDRWGEDHPRVCGEKQTAHGARSLQKGSPPHMRGKAAETASSFMQTRITPALAGKRCRPPEFSSQCRDHPRTCGEKTITPISFISHIGLPPHLRGKGIVNVLVAKPLRITPAHAGKSGVPSIARNSALGSPPHLRGKVKNRLFYGPYRRITPSHAGKSVQKNMISIGRKDHPRTCGEKENLTLNPGANTGSPPHMRGKGRNFPRGVRTERITPAYAGKRSAYR